MFSSRFIEKIQVMNAELFIHYRNFKVFHEIIFRCRRLVELISSPFHVPDHLPNHNLGLKSFDGKPKELGHRFSWQFCVEMVPLKVIRSFLINHPQLNKVGGRESEK